MDEQERWTPADDVAIRGALDTMRVEIDELPLADVRFVKARGTARRRRATVVGVASAAAAVAAFGFIGYHTIGSNQGPDIRPAGPTATTPTAAVPTVPVAAPGPLLSASEWQSALGYTETVKLGEMRPGEGVLSCVSAPGTQIAIGYAVVPSQGFYGVQGTYRSTSPAAGNTASATAVSQLVGPSCQQARENYVAEADAAWPKVFSSAVPNSGGKSWMVVAHQGALTSLLSVGDPILGDSKATTPHFTLDQIQALASAAQQHLVNLADAGAGASQTTGQADLPVAGPRPLLSSDLFVQPSKWASAGLSAGHATKPTTTDWEGGAQVNMCDADLAMDMTPGAGRFGIVAVADQATGTYLGKQRIRLVASAAAANAEVQRLLAAINACPTSDTKASVTRSPTNAGQFKIITGLGTDQEVVEWVAVSANKGTPEAVSTVSLFGRPGLVDGFAELEALMALAVQK